MGRIQPTFIRVKCQSIDPKYLRNTSRWKAKPNGFPGLKPDFCCTHPETNSKTPLKNGWKGRWSGFLFGIRPIFQELLLLVIRGLYVGIFIWIHLVRWRLMECSCFGCWKYLLHIQIEEMIQSSCDTDGFNVQRDNGYICKRWVCWHQHLEKVLPVFFWFSVKWTFWISFMYPLFMGDEFHA